MFLKLGEAVTFGVGDVYFTGVVKAALYNLDHGFVYHVQANQDGMAVYAEVSSPRMKGDSDSGEMYFADVTVSAYIEAASGKKQ